MIDALAYEPHFLAHLAPVWRALPARQRGRFLVDPDLMITARALGIDVVGEPAPKAIPAYPTPVLDGRLALVASYGDIKKGRRMGFGPFVFLEHGIAQSYSGDHRAIEHGSYSGGRDRDDVILNLVPNDHAAARWRATYPDTETLVVGCPKLDSLPCRDESPGPVVAISAHFPCNITIETRPALPYYLSVLPELAQRFTVIGHGHPRYHGIDRVYRRAKIEYVASFDEVCRRADVYVCDNSSTLFEFASTGRPVVVLNSPQYRRDVDHGLRFETSQGCSTTSGPHFCGAAHVGVQVDRPRDLAGAIERALADGPRERANRERALDIVYAHRTGAAERAAAAIVGLREAVAA